MTVAAATAPAPIWLTRTSAEKTYAAPRRSTKEEVPVHVRDFGDAPGLAAQHDDRAEEERADRERDRRRGEAPRVLAKSGVDRGLEGDTAPDDCHDQDRESPVHRVIFPDRWCQRRVDGTLMNISGKGS